MLNKLTKRNNDGFTIIEVMIVLAIAGLILIIVLFAVPGLQRNSRNTALKSDAGQMLAYVNDYVANNDGKMPDANATTGSVVTSGAVTIKSSGGTDTTGKIQSGTDVIFVDALATPALVTPTAGKLTVVYKAKCPVNIAATDTTVQPVASPKSTAVIYLIETSGGSAVKCQGS